VRRELGTLGIYEIEIDLLEYASEFFDRGLDFSFFFLVGNLSKSLDHCE
jgi:hypothetical protein